MSKFRPGPQLVVGLVVIVCGGLLAGAHAVLATRIERNRLLEKVKLQLELVEVGGLSDSEMLEHATRFLIPENDGQGKLHRLRYMAGDRMDRFIYPLSGSGLWGPMEGYLAVSPDLLTITGIRITRHEETPGLGAEIETMAFLRRFEGRRITGSHQDAEVLLRLKKAGTASGDFQVDGISGATETTTGFDRMLQKTLLAIVKDRSFTP